MKYPYAAKGAKKIFIGEIIALFAVLAMIGYSKSKSSGVFSLQS